LQQGILLVIFNIVPYLSVGPLTFGMTAKEVKLALGHVDRAIRAGSGITKIQNFSHDMLAQVSTGADQLLEVGFGKRAKNVSLGKISFFVQPAKHVIAELFALDNAALEGYGAIIYPYLGITLTGFQDDDDNMAMSIFHRGGADQVIPLMKSLKI
jgi:hypothetical protein